MVNPLTARILGDPTFNKNIWTNIKGGFIVVTVYHPGHRRYYRYVVPS